MAKIFHRGKKKKQKTAVMFPGQGVQKLGMAKDIPPEIMEELMGQAKEVLGEGITSHIWSLISPDALQFPSEEKKRMAIELRRTQNAQLAVCLFCLGHWYNLSQTDNFQIPDFMLGHSLGERIALCAGGAMSVKDTIKFIYYLGGLMEMATVLKPGGMKAVLGDINIKKIESCFGKTDVKIANYNSPRQVVISGGREGLMVAEIRLETKGYKVISLNVAGAFHHAVFMASVEGKLDRIFEEFDIEIREPTVPIIFNYTGGVEKDPKRIKTYLIKQPANTVRWQESIEYLIREGVPKGLIQEIGNGRILTDFLDDFPGFIKNQKGIKPSS